MTDSDIAAEAAPSSGIVFAYRFREDGSPLALAPGRIDSALAEPEGWVWVHLALADIRCRAWIAAHAPVSDNAREVLVGDDEHQRLDILGGEVVGVLPDLHHDFLHESEDIVRLRFAMSERVLITARRKPVRSIELTRRAIDAGRVFPTPISFLDAVIDQFADAVARLAERLGDELDLLEERVLHEELGDERQRIGRVRVQSMRVHRQLSLLRSLFHRLERRIDFDIKPVAVALRSLIQKLDSLDHEIGSLYERARLLQDEVAARMTAITNRRLLTLSVLTACLLPPTLVTGFFGMNTADLPLQETDGGSFYALALAAAAGAAIYGLLKRSQAL